MDEKRASPIAPVVAAGTTVTEAWERAQALSARAVVEAGERGVRLHAAGALKALHESGQGGTTLDRLDAIEWGGLAAAPAGHFAFQLVIAEVPAGRRRHRSLVQTFGVSDYAGVVTFGYKCPKDGEKFNGPGKCDRHDVDLVRDDDD